MKKIPTLYKREFSGHKITGIRDEIMPGCEAALTDESIATLKLDGACCAIPCDEPDPVTGHWPHWVKVAADNPADKWFVAARNNSWDDLPDATYEAIGPHFQKNPYGLDKDVLVRHGTISIDIPNPSFEGIRRGLELAAMEGIVFWHEGAPLCKIKRKDFGFKWPVTQDELNAEFGANNPDPCEWVQRVAAVYSRHELPADMTKMEETRA